MILVLVILVEYQVRDEVHDTVPRFVAIVVAGYEYKNVLTPSFWADLTKNSLNRIFPTRGTQLLLAIHQWKVLEVVCLEQ
jgi:hypothetical protein